LPYIDVSMRLKLNGNFMTKTSFAQLSDRALIAVSGSEAEAFLQGLITNDISLLDDKVWLYAGLLTPQGKILFEFFIARQNNGFMLDCALGAKDELIKRLGFYKLRADVSFTALDDKYQMAALWSQSGKIELTFLPEGALCFPDPRLEAAGMRLALPVESLEGFIEQNGLALLDLEHYHQHRISLGLADSADIGSGEHFIHECNFDQLHGVSFSKGCYIGQEVVSRVEHRATARKRMLPVEIKGPPPQAGAIVKAGDKSIGEVLSQADNRAIILLRLDHAEAALAQGLLLTAGDATLHIIAPDWAKFQVPGTQEHA